MVNYFILECGDISFKADDNSYFKVNSSNKIKLKDGLFSYTTCSITNNETNLKLGELYDIEVDFEVVSNENEKKNRAIIGLNLMYDGISELSLGVGEVGSITHVFTSIENTRFKVI